MNIVLLGCPGAGKGTLAKYLVNEFDYIVLTTGELYRKEADLKTEFGLKAKEYWGNGNLCPDSMTNELMSNAISKYSEKDNLIFDGYPRTAAQSKFIDSITNIDLVLDISTSDEVAVKRLLGRAKIENRPDDTEEIVKQRLLVYHKNNNDMIEYYSSDDRYCLIDGSGTPEQTEELARSILFRRTIGA